MLIIFNFNINIKILKKMIDIKNIFNFWWSKIFLSYFFYKKIFKENKYKVYIFLLVKFFKDGKISNIIFLFKQNFLLKNFKENFAN